MASPRDIRFPTRTRAGVALLLTGMASTALGFAEDVCPASLGGGWANCPTQPCAQDLAESGNFVCETIAMATTFLSQAQSTLLGEGRRSTLHMDATYYIAQAVGFTPRQAYQIAAYDQVPDRPRFEFLDERAKPIATRADCKAGGFDPACELVPTPLTGFDRNNFSGAGLNYHFMAPQVTYGAGPMPMDGLAPDLSNPFSEQFLVHVRSWAFGDSHLLCAGGLTTPGARGDHATGDRCYVGERETPSYLGQIPFISETSPLTNLNWVTALGEQQLTLEEPHVSARDLSDFVGAETAPLAALGVYVHAVADRISHHLCVTASRLEGPRPLDAPRIVTLPLAYDVYMLLIFLSNPDYLLQQILTAPVVSDPDFHLAFDDVQCDQLAHAMRHTFEAGHEQGTLKAEHQTVRPGLRYVYDELLAYAQRRGFARTAATSSAYRDQTIDGLIAAITQIDAQERLGALTAFAQTAGYLPLPGYGGLDYASWSAKAGALSVPEGDGTKPDDADGDGGGGAMPVSLLLVLIVVALWASGRRLRRTRLPALALAAATTASLAPSPSQAFAEDLCPSTLGGWTNCQVQLCPSQIAETGNLVCESLAMATNIVGQQLGGIGRRSSLHMDATYYLAQAAGFTPRQAYQIAIYDQAADLGQLDFYGEDGRALVTLDDCGGPLAGEVCELLVKPVTGFDRNNFTGGGLNYHFMAPQRPYGGVTPPLNDFAPDLHDPYGEHFLVHVRRWAFGESKLLCVGGLTAVSASGDYATGDRCFESARVDPSYLGQIPFVDETRLVSTVSWRSSVGEQLINADEPQVRAQDLADYVGQDIAPLLALGVYVHAVADRISHQLCVESSYLEGPRPADAPTIFTLPFGYDVYMALQYLSNPAALLEQLLAAPLVSNPDFLLKFDDAHCDQPSHASRHTFEVGHDQDTLQPEHQTLVPALQFVFEELFEFAQLRGLQSRSIDPTQQRDAIIAGIVSAIEEPQAQARIDELTHFAETMGYLPLPGHGGLSYPEWSARAGELALKANAGSSVEVPSSTAGEETGGGAFTLLLLPFALWRCRQRRATG